MISVVSSLALPLNGQHVVAAHHIEDIFANRIHLPVGMRFAVVAVSELQPVDASTPTRDGFIRIFRAMKANGESVSAADRISPAHTSGA